MNCDRVAPELPSSFGNGLSYYEEMQVLTEKLNEVIEEVNTFDEDFTEVNEKMLVINNDLSTLETNVTNLDTELTQHEMSNNLKFAVIDGSIEALETNVTRIDGEIANKYYFVKNGLVGNNIPLTDSEQISVETWLGIPTNYISFSNTTPFTPTANYQPATKKYVDDKINEAISELDVIIGSGVFE